MKRAKNQTKKIVAIILLLIVIILIGIFIFINNNETEDTVTTANSTEEINVNNEGNQLTVNIAEAEVDTPWEWQHDTLENHNIDRATIENLHTSLDSYPINAEVIVKDGVIVDEYYKEGYDQNSVFTLQSTSKSITSALIGIAIDKGFIEGVDVPISTYFPQILESGSEYKNQITIWHLLTHTTGLDASDTANWNEWLASSNWVDYVLNRFALNVYDMAKFGQLYLNNRVWEGEQIISSEWVEQSTRMQFDRSSGSADYGYQWWVRTFGEQNYPAYFAQGHYGQYIFVVPDLDLVVVFTSHYEGSTSIYWQYMNNIVNACQ